MDQRTQGVTARHSLTPSVPTHADAHVVIEIKEPVPSYEAVHSASGQEDRASGTALIDRRVLQRVQPPWPRGFVALGVLMAPWPRVAAYSLAAIRTCLGHLPDCDEMMAYLFEAGADQRPAVIKALVDRILRASRAEAAQASAFRDLALALGGLAAAPGDVALVMRALHAHRHRLGATRTAVIVHALALDDACSDPATRGRQWRVLLQPTAWQWDRHDDRVHAPHGAYDFVARLCDERRGKHMDPALRRHILDFIAGPLDNRGTVMPLAGRIRCRERALAAYGQSVIKRDEGEDDNALASLLGIDLPPLPIAPEEIERIRSLLMEVAGALGRSRHCGPVERRVLLEQLLEDRVSWKHLRRHTAAAAPALVRHYLDCRRESAFASPEPLKIGVDLLLPTLFRAGASGSAAQRQQWHEEVLTRCLDTSAALHPRDIADALHEFNDVSKNNEVVRPLLLKIMRKPDFPHARACARGLYLDLSLRGETQVDRKSERAEKARLAFVSEVAARLRELMAACPIDMEPWYLALLVHEAARVVRSCAAGAGDLEHLFGAVVQAAGRFDKARQRLMVPALAVGWGRLDPREQRDWPSLDKRLDRAFKQQDIRALPHAQGMAAMRSQPVHESDRLALLHMACRLGEPYLSLRDQLAHVRRIIPRHARSTALTWIARQSLPELGQDEWSLQRLTQTNEHLQQVLRAMLEPLAASDGASSQTSASKDTKREVDDQGLDEGGSDRAFMSEHMEQVLRWWSACEDAAGLRFVHGLQDDADGREMARQSRHYLEAALLRTVQARKDIVCLLGKQRAACDELLQEVTRFEQALERALRMAQGPSHLKTAPETNQAGARRPERKAEFRGLEALLDSGEHDPTRLYKQGAAIAQDQASWSQDADVACGVVRRIAQHAARRSSAELEALMAGVAPRLGAHRAVVMSAINEEAAGLDAQKRRALFTGLRMGENRDKSD